MKNIKNIVWIDGLSNIKKEILFIKYNLIEGI